MDIKVINESGYDQALLGLSLSYNQSENIGKMPEIAKRLCDKDFGHNKFLESIIVWLDVKAARYWWQEFDTYRVGTTKQSESTMHTITLRTLTQKDFEHKIFEETLNNLNQAIKEKDFIKVKANLPESFLQRRIVCTNYKVLRNMILQRRNHKLQEWQVFISEILKQIRHSYLLPCLANK